MRFYLLTYHGTLVSRVKGNTELTQVEVGAHVSREDLVAVDLDPDTFRQPYEDFIANTAAAPFNATIRHLGDCIVHPNAKLRAIAIFFDGLFVSAQPQGAIEINRNEQLGWELFLPCSDQDLDFLVLLLSSKWVVKSKRALIDGSSIVFTQDYTMKIGDLNIPLAYNLPVDRCNYPFRFVVLSEGWKINELILFKPMIYYLAFGQDNVFQQLHLSLESLAKIGRYDGKILIFTDRTRDSLCKDSPWLDTDLIEVATIRARDWVGFVAGKYCILEEERAYHYQPVVYMDPDIIFNTDAKSFLIEMAVSDRITAPIETFSGLEHAPSVGATLLQMDNEQPRFACGFNCGTIGIPNLPAHRHTLQLIRKIISNFLSIRGRSAFLWVDQEAANYVSYKIANFDTNQVSKCVRYGFEQTPVETGPLSGLVHFWGVGRASRPDIMREYLDRVLDHYNRLKNRHSDDNEGSDSGI